MKVTLGLFYLTWAALAVEVGILVFDVASARWGSLVYPLGGGVVVVASLWLQRSSIASMRRSYASIAESKARIAESQARVERLLRGLR